MMFRLMSPQPPYVFEPTLAIAAITVFRLPLSTPWSWKAWRVVARRSPWPYLFDRSSSSLYTAGGISPHGTLRRSMNWYDFCFSFPLSIRFCCMYEPWCLRMWIESFETKISSSPMSVSSGSRSPFEAAFTTWTVSCVSRLVHGRPPGAGCAGAVGPTVCVSSAGERARARERRAKGRGPGEWRRNCAVRAAGCIAGERTEPKVGRRGRRRARTMSIARCTMLRPAPAPIWYACTAVAAASSVYARAYIAGFAEVATRSTSRNATQSNLDRDVLLRCLFARLAAAKHAARSTARTQICEISPGEQRLRGMSRATLRVQFLDASASHELAASGSVGTLRRRVAEARGLPADARVRLCLRGEEITDDGRGAGALEGETLTAWTPRYSAGLSSQLAERSERLRPGARRGTRLCEPAAVAEGDRRRADTRAGGARSGAPRAARRVGARVRGSCSRSSRCGCSCGRPF